MASFWVSFATDQKFLGVAIVDVAETEPEAVEVVEEAESPNPDRILRECNH